MKKKGFAIILVLATLVLLAMLSLTYIKLALIDRNIARNYMDNKRAKLIAQSGVDYAIARLQENPLDTSWQQAKLIKINGIDTNYTESTGSTYGENRDIFAVTVKDCQSMINVNDGLNNPRVRDNTKKILKALGDVVGVADLGNKIIDNRSVQGYQSKQELLKYLTLDEFKQIKDFITTHAWQDPDVANPVPLSTDVITAYDPVRYNTGLTTSSGTIDVYRYGRGYNKYGNLVNAPLLFAPDFASGDQLNHAIYALDELNPQWIEIVSRSPVNINTAPREVLIALLKDLRGFFVSDRRRNSPKHNSIYDLSDATKDEYYQPRPDGLTKHAYDYSPASPMGDEAGFLYATKEIDSTLATNIADEMISCRDKAGSYTTKWFGSLFKTWRQFNTFCEDLITRSPAVLEDTRTIFYEYGLNAPDYYLDGGTMTIVLENDPTNFDQLVLSEVARRQASQAMADVLKANFNPNLHLNELNPDAKIKLLVDKTDLIVNSTEFCFTPMGYFEIESEGLILKDKGADNVVIANSKITTVVKLFDAYRETAQKQFLEGEIPNIDPLTTIIKTNNGKYLEIGPELSHVFDAGKSIAKQNEYSGYISLPTIKAESPIDSPVSSTTTTTANVRESTSTDEQTEELDKPRRGWKTITKITTTITLDKTVITATATAGIFSPTFYVQLKENFDADYHADGDTYKPNITVNNIADKTESGERGPYTYNLDNRLARSFRNQSEVEPSTIPGSYAYRAGADLRIDGAYIERHSGLAYRFNGTSTNVFRNPGMFSYWLKPSFYPETTGKPRTFFSLTKNNWAAKAALSSPASLIFGHFFLPSHWPSAVLSRESESLKYTVANLGISAADPDYIGFRSTSMLFGYSCFSTPTQTGMRDGDGIGHSTPILNHLSHLGNPCYSSKPNHLKSGQWIYVACIWNLPTLSIKELAVLHTRPGDEYAQVWINGSKLADSSPINYDFYANPMSDYLGASIFRIGEPCRGSVDDYIRNWTSDSTVDEFCIFSAGGTAEVTTTETGTKTTKITTVTEVYNKDGLLDSTSTTTDTSTEPIPPTTTTTTGAADSLQVLGDAIIKTYANGRYFKPHAADQSWFKSQGLDLSSNTKLQPFESTISNPPGSVPGSSVDNLPSQTKIIGLSWTWFAEEVDSSSGRPLLKNYKDVASPAPIYPRIEIKLVNVSGNLTDEKNDDGYSEVTLVLNPGESIRYQVIFKLEKSDGTWSSADADNTVLLYTPLFDDITIYYTSGVKFLSWSYFD